FCQGCSRWITATGGEPACIPRLPALCSSRADLRLRWDSPAGRLVAAQPALPARRNFWVGRAARAEAGPGAARWYRGDRGGGPAPGGWLGPGWPARPGCAAPDAAGWQQDADQAAVHDNEWLAAMPEADRQRWRKLWADVGALFPKAKP